MPYLAGNFKSLHTNQIRPEVQNDLYLQPLQTLHKALVMCLAALTCEIVKQDR